MMVNGVNSYSNYFNYQSALSEIRLQQALSKNPSYQSVVEPVSKVASPTAGFQSSSLDFLRQYSGNMSDVMQSANSLRGANSAGVMNDLTVTSSDSAIAGVSERYAIRQEKDISLEVSQLAVAQQNVSNGVKSSDSSGQDMAFTISGSSGSLNVNVNAVKEDGTGKTNKEMLQEAAVQINKGNAGLTASVKEKDGVSSLVLSSKDTGTAAAFTVSGNMGAAEGIQKTGTEAQNAQYSVTTDGHTKSYTSQSNQIQLDAGRIQADLKGTGKTTISATVDSEKIASAVSDLLKNYNDAVSFLKKNTGHGQGTQNQLARLESAFGTDDTMKRLGISKSKDGTLVLDKEVLKKSLQEEPDLTKDLISGSYGLAQKMYDRGVGAMNTNSTSLISNDLKEIEQSMASTDSFHFMNLYSRTGAHNMTNYMAVGLMMNYLA